MSKHLIKTLLTRVGEGTKIVLTGDLDQIDTPYLDASTSGLAIATEKLKNEEIAGHITLIKGERSEVAELCSKIL
jgi:PhoH-like ATPase